ncbi:MAG: EAL domain-containing protein [Rhodocyclaceae bacterium]|nr:EAL domain-containing protein [Rhodocyclaceae bacterium]
MAETSSQEHSVETRLLYAAYSRKPINIFLVVASTFVVGGVLWPVFPATVVSTWIIALLLCQVLGGIEVIAFRRAKPGPADILIWQRLFFAQSATTGAAWAVGPTLLIGQNMGAESAFFVGTLMSVAVVAMISVAEQRSAMIAMISSVFLPPMIAFLLTGGAVEQRIALVLFCGMSAAITVGVFFNHAMRKLVEAQMRTDFMLDTALGAVIGMNAQGKINRWSHHAEVVFGWSHDEAIGRAFAETVIPQQRVGADGRRVGQLLLDGDEQILNRKLELIATRKDGTEFPIELVLTAHKIANKSEFTVFVADITERKQANDAMQDSEKRFRTLMECVPEAVAVHRDGRVLYVNDAAIRLLGARVADDIVGHSILDRVHPDFRAIVAARMAAATEPGAVTPLLEEKLLRLDGITVDTEIQGIRIVYDGQSATLVTVRDITVRKQAQERLLAANQALALAFDQAPLGVIDWDLERRVLRWNPAAETIFGYTAAEAIGRPAMFIVPKSAQAAIAALGTALLSGQGGGRSSNENVRQDGQIIQCEWYNAALRDMNGVVVGATSLVADITARKKAEDEIQSLAFHDSLTQLPNRRLLLDRLKHAVASSTRSERYTALMFIDLDKFKALNDHHGHDVGDLLLKEVAQRLNSCVRDVDTVARLGGDEFIVMLEALSEKLDEAGAQAEVIGRKILAALSAPYELDGNNHRSSSSIGVTLFKNFDGSADDLLKRADLAMYQAKAAGRNTLSFFDPGLQAELTHRLTLETELRDAMQKEEFLVYYQAQVIDDSRLSGVEALVRWNHPHRGIVAPLDFITVAEETGVILPLGRWVLRTACAQLAAWSTRAEMAHLTISVNVSASQLRLPLFVEEVLTTLQESGANPQRLKLELTESQLVYDMEDVVAKMARLKAAGVGLSLDDFGTGYSSLSYLKRLPLDELKIDQGFIRHILDDAIDAAISSMVVTLAKSMGLGVIAEGVETEAQRQYLAAHGCNSCQGFLFSHPLPLAEFEAFAARKVHKISAHTGA